MAAELAMTIVTCESCGGYKGIPPKYTCPKCYESLVEKQVSGLGTIYSLTTIHVAPGKFAELAPYPIILVELDEGLRVTARLENENETGEVSPAIGQRVQLSRYDQLVYWFRGV